MPAHDFDPPDRFVVGTVGPPGQRTFFLQASGGRRLVTVSCEKEQVAVLADRIVAVLDEVAGPPAQGDPAGPEDNEPLSTPIEDEFRVVTLSLAWDSGRGVMVIECHDEDVDVLEEGSGEEVPEVVETVEARSSLRVVIGPAQAREFARRAQVLVAAGRPPCPFCGGPLDPTGHVCPRANGYKR